MDNGIRTDLTDDEYFAIDRMSSSGIKKFMRSPLHFKSGHIYSKSNKGALKVGSATHCALLEPHLLEVNFFCLPTWGGAGSKARKEQALAENPNKVGLSESEWNEALTLRDAVLSNEVAELVLSRTSHKEVAAFWTDDRTGVDCKAKLDAVSAANRCIIDLKTTQDASPREFTRSATNFGYYMQAAFYLDGWNKCSSQQVDTFLFIAVEKEAPYAVQVYEITPEFLAIGREKYIMALERYKECVQQDRWPSYSNKIERLHAPEWLIAEHEGCAFEPMEGEA